MTPLESEIREVLEEFERGLISTYKVDGCTTSTITQIHKNQSIGRILSLHNREVKELVGIDSIKKALYNWEERWLLCWDGEPDGMAFDCACCIDQSSNKECQCICHKREKEIAQALSKYGRKEIKNG